MTCAKVGWNPVGGGSTRQERKSKEKRTKKEQACEPALNYFTGKASLSSLSEGKGAFPGL